MPIKKVPTDLTSIYRYIDLPELISILFKEEFFFKRADKFSDQNEFSIIPFHGFLNFIYSNRSSDGNNIPFISNENLDQINNIKNNSFMTSWSIEKDSFALWKIYANNNPYSFCIESSIRDLNDSLSFPKDIMIVKDFVEYDLPHRLDKLELFKKSLEDKEVENILKIISFVKSTCYSYEKEYRIVMYNEKFGNQDISIDTDINQEIHVKAYNGQGISLKTNNSQGILVKADISRLIKRIHVSPFMPAWFKEILTKDVPEYFEESTFVKGSEIFKKFSQLAKISLHSKISEKQ